MLSSGDVIELIRDRLYPAFRQERERLDRIDLWYRWQAEPLTIPRGATPELKALQELSRTPWLGLVVTNVAQSMFVDGYRSPESNDDRAPWRLWQANDLDGRQVAIHRAALAYGQAYGTALPGVDDFGEPTAVLRGVSPRRMLAFYTDPTEDDWPRFALRVDAAGREWMLRLYDEERVYYVALRDGGWTYIEDRVHDAGVCPVVRFANQLDLEGRTDGEVEPFIPLAKRINKTTYDRLLTQHFSSWKVRTVAGMVQPDTPEEATEKRIQLRQDDLLVAEDPDTKFGTLPETALDGFIRAGDADVKTLAAATQTPVHALTGDMINLSAEALAAARASLDAKVAERQRAMGKSHDQWLRLGSLINGDVDSARDVMAHVTWADTSIRSLAEAADALGKLATMLGVPPQALWSRVPGVSRTDVQEWERIAGEGDAFAQLGSVLERQASPVDPVEMKAKADAMGVLIRAGVSAESAARQVGLAGVEFTGAVPTSLRLPSREATGLEE